jgi:hypothetical protein
MLKNMRVAAASVIATLVLSMQPVAAQYNQQGAGELPVTLGINVTVIAAGTNTSCKVEYVYPKTIHKIFSAAVSETATVSLYNDQTCTAADLIWSGVPSNTVPVWIDVPFSNAWSVKTSGATVNNTIITTN